MAYKGVEHLTAPSLTGSGMKERRVDYPPRISLTCLVAFVSSSLNIITDIDECPELGPLRPSNMQ